MKRSNQQKVVLLLAGTLAAGMAGCGRPTRKEEVNNAYVTDMGYYHAETGGYYPYPYNYYVPNMGYYGGSRGWTASPHRLTRVVSIPTYNYSNRVPIQPLPNIAPPPAPRPTPSYNSSPSSSAPRPAASGVKTGGFGSSGGSAVS